MPDANVDGNHSLSIFLRRRWTAAWGFELLGIAGLCILATFYIATSWRKWPDPLIDFGAQLYNAWQISQGAVLYRDISCVYGPLSQYFNGGIFFLFGPGLLVLTLVNLIIFTLFAAGVYLLLRRGWGVVAALVSVAILISIFGFSHFVYGGNYNYVAPYAHETTHGMLLCVVLCFVLLRWTEKGNLAFSFLAGLLCGCTFVLKPEFIFAAALLTFVAVGTRWRWRSRVTLPEFVLWVAGALLPTFLFALYFTRFMSVAEALAAASRGWLNTLDPSFRNDYLEVRLLGLDHPWPHLIEHAVATAVAVGVFGVIAVLAALVDRKIPTKLAPILIVAVTVGFGVLGSFYVNWINIGRCLLGLALIYTLAASVRLLMGPFASNADINQATSRLLVATLASALMARMILNGRVYHYGYYQAALAAILPPAVVIGELPVWLRSHSRGRVLAIFATVALLLPGAVILTQRSQHAFALKTFPVATGRDRYYTFAPEVDAIGRVIDSVTSALASRGRGETLVVLPEGEFINYLARLRNPLPYSTFYAVTTEGGRETEVVGQLDQQRPYWIVIITLDLWGHGIDRYGQKPGQGEQILYWVEHNYQQIAAIGGDPLDYRERGARVLRRYR